MANQKVHAQYGGVVPELASRAHQQNIVPVVDQALKKAGNTEVTSRLIPNLNHMLQPAKTGLPKEVDSIEMTIAPEVLLLMKDFIQKQAKRD